MYPFELLFTLKCRTPAPTPATPGPMVPSFARGTGGTTVTIRESPSGYMRVGSTVGSCGERTRVVEEEPGIAASFAMSNRSNPPGAFSGLVLARVSTIRVACAKVDGADDPGTPGSHKLCEGNGAVPDCDKLVCQPAPPAPLAFSFSRVPPRALPLPSEPTAPLITERLRRLSTCADGLAVAPVPKDDEAPALVPETGGDEESVGRCTCTWACAGAYACEGDGEVIVG